jgi:transposase InsO family protein
MELQIVPRVLKLPPDAAEKQVDYVMCADLFPTGWHATGPAGVEPSVGSKGDSYDNALAETINGWYKAELIHRRAPWKTREAVELATLEWVSWFNHHRLLEPLGYIPPAEAEANYYRQLIEQAMTD